MQTLEANWMGPFGWPNYEADSGLPALPACAGVYLQTVEYEDGYAIYLAGLTRRAVAQRMREHTRKTLSGDYNILDLAQMQRGIRREMWHGWGWTPEKREQWEERQTEIATAARAQMAGFRLFVADIGTAPRLLERLEAAVMNALYAQNAPLCDLPDRGMMLAPRRASEELIVAHNRCKVRLYGLPEQLEI